MSFETIIAGNKKAHFLGTWALLFLLGSACSSDEVKSTKPVNTDLNQILGDENGIGEPTDGNSTDHSSETKDDGTSTSKDKDDDKALQLRAFFRDKVLASFENASCKNCHAEPRDNPIMPAPMSIYSYLAMKKVLSLGTGAFGNDLLKKVNNSIFHGGGDQCGVQFDGGPCDMITQWWALEFQGEDQGSGLFVADVDQISALGEFGGYAAAKNDPTLFADVSIFGGGKKGEGVLISELQANLQGYAAGVSGGHRFQLLLPAEYRDGNSHDIHVYVSLGNEEFEMAGSPFKVTAYAPKANGETYYNNNVNGLLSSNCGACHSFDYESAYFQLLSPAPYLGGTPTNNSMINRVAGEGNHPRTFCSKSSNDPLCRNLREWWNQEFAN
jgi:hypothetical protein